MVDPQRFLLNAADLNISELLGEWWKRGCWGY